KGGHPQRRLTLARTNTKKLSRSVLQVVVAADDALYLAKARGRDCSVVADTEQFSEDVVVRPTDH
ncbi:MAG: hypothetical protein ACXV5U_13945, partial [Ilumatobacteraceae bacterium]